MATGRGPGRPRKIREAELLATQAAESKEADKTIELPETPVDFDLGEVLSSLAGASRAKITVYRSVRNQRPVYLFECEPGEFSLTNLRDNFGGGDFRLYIQSDGVLIRNIAVSVEQAPKKLDQTSQSSDALVHVMREGFAAQAQAMRDLLPVIQRPASPPIDIPAMITAVAGAIGAIRKMVEPAPGVAPAQAIAPDQLFNVLLKGIELGKETGGGGDGDSMVSVLRDLIRSPLLAAAAAPAIPAAAPVPVIVHQTPPGVGQVPQPAPSMANIPARVDNPPKQQPQTQSNPEEKMMMKGYVGALVQRAENGSPPGLYAAYILDNMPEEMVREFIARPDVVDFLASIDPRVTQHRAWFESMKNEIQELLAEDDDENLTDDGGLGEHVP